MKLPMRSLTAMLVLFISAGPVLAEGPATAEGKTGGDKWGANYFPNVELTTHEGKKVRFFDDVIAGKVVVINFIYTRCPDACPLETARHAEVQGILGDRVGRDCHFYSITIDPEHDTPAVLKDYAERYQVADGWTFLTGDDEDITLLRKKLGLYIDEIQGDDSNDHNLSLVIGNQKTGRWVKSSPFENPYVLATQIGTWFHDYKVQSGVVNDYANAPELRKITTGESLFRTRCATCHAVEEDGKKRVGPNLHGVIDRREHDWLVRWIKEPDVMLAEGDTIAQGLFLAYNQVPMPNMRLSEYEVEQVLTYIAAETRRVSKAQAISAVVPENDGEELASCCEKDDAPVLSSVDESAEDDCCAESELDDCCAEGSDLADGRGAPISRSSMLSGLGCVLGLLAVFLRRRSL